LLMVADHKDMTTLEKEVQRVLDMKKGSLDVIVVDLSGVPFVLSSAIAQIVKLFKSSKKLTSAFRVVNAGSQNYDMLKTLRLTELFEVTR